jgi:hypothetical protein
MRGTVTKAYQFVLLVCFLLEAVSKTFEASVLQVAFPQSDSRSADYCALITLLFGYAVPLAGLIPCYRRDIQLLKSY